MGNGHHHCPVKGWPKLMPAEARLSLAMLCSPLRPYPSATPTECLLPLPAQGPTPPLALLSPHLKAVRYSTSPMGGSTPPVHATLTLYPMPGPPPTWHKVGEVTITALDPKHCSLPPPHTPPLFSLTSSQICVVLPLGAQECHRGHHYEWTSVASCQILACYLPKGLT